MSWTLIVLLVFAFAGELHAHAQLERSAPSTDERLTTAPAEIRLWFSETPQLAFTHVSLVSATDSTPVPLGAVRAGDERSVILPVAGKMAPGRYVVRWQTGGADGHPSRGSFAFVVAPGTTAGTGAQAVAAGDSGRVAGTRGNDTSGTGTSRANAPFDVATEKPLSSTVSAFAAARWLELGSLLALIGCVGMRLVVLSLASRAGVPPARPSENVRRLARFATALLIATYLVRLHLELRQMHGPQAYQIDVVRATLLDTTWGRGWMFGMFSVLLAAAGLSIARRSSAAWAIVALGAIAAAFAPGLTGHAIALAGTPGVVVDGLHVLGAGIWIGTLMALVLAAFPALRAEGAPAGPLPFGTSVAIVVRSFNPVALTGALLMVAAGAASAWIRLGSFETLVFSDYGRILLLKLGLVAIVVLLGAFNWRRMSPTLGDEASARRIRRSATAELLIAALVLAVTAVLVGTPPPAADDGQEAGVAPSVTSARVAGR